MLAFYVGITFLVMEVLYLFVWCTPFRQYWQVIPLPSIQCSAAINHLITNAVFNITSDIAMLAIAFSLFLGNQLPLSRKLALCAIFGLGLFTILCAILNKYYSFTHPFGSEWTYWYVRESSTALIVANMPFTWGILRRLCGVRAFNPTTGTADNTAEGSIVQNPGSMGFRSPPDSRVGSSKPEHAISENMIGELPSPTTPPISPSWSTTTRDFVRRGTSPDLYGHPKYGHEHLPQRKKSAQPDWRKAGISGKQDLELLELGEGFGSAKDMYAFDFGFGRSTPKRSSGDSTTVSGPGSERLGSVAEGAVLGKAVSSEAGDKRANSEDDEKRSH
jgi:hypothetical protein